MREVFPEAAARKFKPKVCIRSLEELELCLESNRLKQVASRTEIKC